MPFDAALNPAAILTALGITNATAITPVHGGTDTTRESFAPSPPYVSLVLGGG